MLQPLFRELEAALQKSDVLAGFRFRKSNRDFVQRRNGTTLAVHLSYIKHAHDFDVTIDVAIRFEAVENVLNASRKYLSSREKANTFTIGAELGNLREGRQKRWTIASVRDIHPVVADVGLWLAEVGLPFFEEYSDLDRAQSALEVVSLGRLLAPLNRDEVVAAMRRVAGS